MKRILKKWIQYGTKRLCVRFFTPDEILAILEGEIGPFTGVAERLTYRQDGLATVHNADFMKDERFRAAYKAGEATGSWGGDIHWRAHVVCWAAERGRNLPGDFVEFGVNRGGYARMVIEYVGFSDLKKTFYLFDTFAGLVDKYISDSERQRGIKPGGYAECYEAVCRTFAPFPNVKIVRGVIPETLPQLNTTQIAFVSMDLNCAAPEIAAAEYVWPKMVSGAVMVLDDYGWARHYEQKKAFDAFAKSKGCAVLALPTGQGLLIKP
jgi:O-methyltransferase